MKSQVKAEQQHYSRFAEYYEAIYNEIVDYKSQTSFLERIFVKFHKGPVRSILDMVCSTGNFTLLFGEQDYVTIGFDLSDEIIRVTKEKKNDERKYKNVQFLKIDMRGIQFGDNGCDVGTVLFRGFGYLLEYVEVRKFFAGVRRHLKKDGLLIFEFWHVSGVRSEGSSRAGYVSW